jgi:hypothetical protein
VRFVALPDVPLDFSAEDERRLLERGVPSLTLVHRSPRWRIWRFSGTPPSPLTGARVDGFDLRAAPRERVVVRQHYTPYWTVTAGAACVEETPGDWTAVRVLRPGNIAVRARFSLDGALRRAPECRAEPDP